MPESTIDTAAELNYLYCELESAATFIRVLGEELVLHGMPSGDRTVILSNVRTMISINKRYAEALAAIRAALNQNATYPEDVQAARVFANGAIVWATEVMEVPHA